MSNHSNDDLFTFESHGRNFHLHLPDRQDHIQATIREQGKFYEGAMLDDAFGRLEPGGLAVDVGANIGNHSLFFAGVCGLRVIAIEPEIHCGEILERNVALNDLVDQIELLQKAAGAEAGTGTVDVVDPRNLGKTQVRVSDDGKGDVEILTLDSLKLASEVALLKIDVEGMELDVLRGATQLLFAARPLIYVEASSIEHLSGIRHFLDDFGYVDAQEFNWTPTHLFLPVRNERERFDALMARIDSRRTDHHEQRIAARLASLREGLDLRRVRSDVEGLAVVGR